MCHTGYVNRSLKRTLFCTSNLVLFFSASYARHAKARHQRLDIKFYEEDKNFTSGRKTLLLRVAADTRTKRTRRNKNEFTREISTKARRINSNNRGTLSSFRIFWWTTKFDDAFTSFAECTLHIRVYVKLSELRQRYLRHEWFRSVALSLW